MALGQQFRTERNSFLTPAPGTPGEPSLSSSASFGTMGGGPLYTSTICCSTLSRSAGGFSPRISALRPLPNDREKSKGTI